MKTAMTALAVLCVGASPALAQYYAQPGYYPPPGPPPGYYQAPPPRPYYREIGRHCRVFLPTGYGGQRYVCRIVDPKPVGEGCACPAPPPGPGYPPGPYIEGRTVP